MITYQDKYQVVPATNIRTQKQQFVVNRVNRPDDGYAQDNGYFYQYASTLKDVLWLVDCFFSDFSELVDDTWTYDNDLWDEEEGETRIFVIPTYLLSYFINGDFAGLDKEEFDLIESFLFVNQIDLTKGHFFHFRYDDFEPYFSWDNDLSDVGGSVVEIKWVDMSNTSTNDFDIWLSANYIPAGEGNDGEEWYLSNSPNEFMPFPLSDIKQKWESENYIQESSEDSKPYSLFMRSSSGHPITLHISEERIIVDTERSSNIY